MITGSKESPLQYQNTRTRLNRNGNSNNFIATHPPLYLVTGRSVCVWGGGVIENIHNDTRAKYMSKATKIDICDTNACHILVKESKD